MTEYSLEFTTSGRTFNSVASFENPTINDLITFKQIPLKIINIEEHEEGQMLTKIICEVNDSDLNLFAIQSLFSANFEL
jgi:hypothetical protein